jgi:hypothetical protein
MRDRWLRVFARVDVCQAFIVVGESHTELFSACFLVAHRQDKPVSTILIPLEPRGLTCIWALDAGSDLPWCLGLKVHTAEDNREHVEFHHDMSFFCDLCTRAQELGVRDVVARRLDFELTSMDTLRVTGLGNMKSISSSVLDDMASLTALDSTLLAQGEDCLSDLHELREAGPLPRQALDDAADDGDGDGENDEYSFESELAAGARAQLVRIVADVGVQDTLIEGARRSDPVGAVDVDAGMSADEVSGSSSSSSNPAASLPRVPLDAVDFPSLAQYMHRVPGQKWPQVITSAGVVVGEIQTISGVFRPYQAIAVCCRPCHQGRCTRMRAWKISNEHPSRVEHVLIWWLMQDHASTSEHMNTPRP